MATAFFVSMLMGLRYDEGMPSSAATRAFWWAPLPTPPVSMPLPSVHLTPLLLAPLFVVGLASAQSLPSPSRTVFKCDEGGRIVYSDVPCMGAKKLDVEPTRGVSKLSGKERIGNDVRREVFQEQMADAMRPISGMNAKQYEAFGRRLKLTPDAQRECRQLDSQLPVLERSEQQASGPELPAAQRRLFGLRSRYRELGC